MNPRLSMLVPVVALAAYLAGGPAVSLAAEPAPRAALASLEQLRALSVTTDVGGGETVSLFVEGSASEAALEARGAILGTLLPDGRRTLRVPLDRLEELAATPGLTRILASYRCRTMNNLSVPTTGATPGFWTTPVAGDFGGNAGGGAIIGVVDTGIDWNHDDFKRPNGTTRILSIWDQRAAGTPPNGFGYGREWSAAQINSGSCTHQDTDGHGTHVAGSAAGDGSATGNGQPAFRFPGMAPEAELIVVATDFQTASIVDGANYIFQRAAAQGKPAVVLITAGTQFGPHDGTGAFDVALDALTGPGRIIVAAAGNAGGAALHAEQPVPPGGGQSITFDVPAYTPNAGNDNDFVQIEAYYRAGANLSVTLVSPGPNPVTIGPVPIGEQWASGVITAGDLYIENNYLEPSEGDRNVLIEIKELNNVPPRAGTWTIQLTPITAPPGTEFDAWLADYVLGAAGVAPAFTSDVDESELVASPGSAAKAITAGAYVTKANWPSIDGGSYLYTGLTGIGTLAGYSSPGPLRNGAPKPEITAPGSAIVSSYSSTATLGQPFINPDGRHATATGTSMAAAHVAGACALLLAAAPGQTPEDLKAKFAVDAVADEFTGVVPNARWGAGKLKIVNGDTQKPNARLIAPNGGENFAMGSTHAVTWQAGDNVAVTSVTLDFSTNDGGTFAPIASGLANSGSFNWVVPGSPTTLGRVRVRAFDAAGNVGQDVSDAPFTISDQAPPTVHVIAPNGGQSFPTGSVQNITWSATDNIGVISVTLEYSLNGGGAFTTIATGEANDGSFFWTVPQTPTTEALVRVRAFDLAGNAGEDTGDAPFTIADLAAPSANLTAPNGGENWNVGSTQTITWSAADNVAVTGILLELSTDGGGNWRPIAADEPNDGSYTWVIPATPTSGARVRVSASDAAGNIGRDSSNGNFAIVDAEPPAVALTAPLQGEIWAVGESRSITWTATDNVAVASVKLEFSSNDGSGYTTIAESLTNSGVHVWSVPNTPSVTARIRISVLDSSGLATIRVSERFTIQAPDLTAPTVTLTAPNGGEIWPAGSTQSIAWNAADDVAVTSILLEFSISSGGSFVTIVDLPGNPGSYVWTLPEVATTQGRIRVTARDGAGNSRQDLSDAPFTIQVADTEPPTITLNAPNGGESLTVASNLFITWTAADNVGVTAIAIDLSTDGGGLFTPIVTGEANDGSFDWTVPNRPTTAGRIRVRAFDAAGNVGQDVSDGVFSIVALPPQTVTVTVNTQGSAEISGYRMVTFPVVPTNGSLAATLQDDLGAPDVTRWRFGHWDPTRGTNGGYRSADGGDLARLEIGLGYWLLTRDAHAVDVVGQPVEADTFSVPLPGPAGGWHQVGNPFRVAIPFDQLRFQLAGGGTAPVTQALRGWTGGPGYTVVGAGGTLAPQTGYWVQKTDSNQTRLIFRRPAVVADGMGRPGADPSSATGSSVTVTLEVRRGGASAGTVTFGLADVSAGEWNVLSRALPPAVPGGGRGPHLVQRAWGDMSGDYESLFLPHSDELNFEFVPGDADAGARVDVVMADAPPAGWSVRIEDVAATRRWIVDASNPASIPLPAPGAALRLILARSSVDAGPAAPRRLAHPNPFTESTRLSFNPALPPDSEVRIFDANGRLRRFLAGAGGASELSWDGRDDRGEPVSAGLYYVRVRSMTSGQDQTLRLVRTTRGR